jgi:cytochrome c peroxidase
LPQSKHVNFYHNIGLGGADQETTSIGHHWQCGGRNARPFSTPQHSSFWDVRAKDFEQQAGGPTINSVEMPSPKAHVAEQLRGIPGYLDAFKKAFPGEADPIKQSQMAIAAFEATLITPNDAVMALLDPFAARQLLI